MENGEARQVREIHSPTFSLEKSRNSVYSFPSKKHVLQAKEGI